MAHLFATGKYEDESDERADDRADDRSREAERAGSFARLSDVSGGHSDVIRGNARAVERMRGRDRARVVRERRDDGLFFELVLNGAHADRTRRTRA